MSQNSPFERYKEYTLKLEQEGRKFPVNQFGEPNLTKIAEESGLRRQWFSENFRRTFGDDNKSLDAILKADINRIGTNKARPKDPAERLSNIADNRSREASQLRQMLEIKSRENEQLRLDVDELNREIQRLKNKLSEAEIRKKELLNSGRLFSL